SAAGDHAARSGFCFSFASKQAKRCNPAHEHLGSRVWQRVDHFADLAGGCVWRGNAGRRSGGGWRRSGSADRAMDVAILSGERAVGLVRVRVLGRRVFDERNTRGPAGGLSLASDPGGDNDGGTGGTGTFARVVRSEMVFLSTI